MFVRYARKRAPELAWSYENMSEFYMQKIAGVDISFDLPTSVLKQVLVDESDADSLVSLDKIKSNDKIQLYLAIINCFRAYESIVNEGRRTKFRAFDENTYNWFVAETKKIFDVIKRWQVETSYNHDDDEVNEDGKKTTDIREIIGYYKNVIASILTKDSLIVPKTLECIVARQLIANYNDKNFVNQNSSKLRVDKVVFAPDDDDGNEKVSSITRTEYENRCNELKSELKQKWSELDSNVYSQHKYWLLDEVLFFVVLPQIVYVDFILDDDNNNNGASTTKTTPTSEVNEEETFFCADISINRMQTMCNLFCHSFVTIKSKPLYSYTNVINTFIVPNVLKFRRFVDKYWVDYLSTFTAPHNSLSTIFRLKKRYPSLAIDENRNEESSSSSILSTDKLQFIFNNFKTGAYNNILYKLLEKYLVREFPDVFEQFEYARTRYVMYLMPWAMLVLKYDNVERIINRASLNSNFIFVQIQLAMFVLTLNSVGNDKKMLLQQQQQQNSSGDGGAGDTNSGDVADKKLLKKYMAAAKRQQQPHQTNTQVNKKVEVTSQLFNDAFTAVVKMLQIPVEPPALNTNRVDFMAPVYARNSLHYDETTSAAIIKLFRVMHAYFADYEIDNSNETSRTTIVTPD